MWGFKWRKLIAQCFTSMNGFTEKVFNDKTDGTRSIRLHNFCLQLLWVPTWIRFFFSKMKNLIVWSSHELLPQNLRRFLWTSPNRQHFCEIWDVYGNQYIFFTLQLIAFVHFALLVNAMLSHWQPPAYLFYNVLFMVSLMWAVHSRESVDAVHTVSRWTFSLTMSLNWVYF